MAKQLALRVSLSDTASFSNFFAMGNEEAVQALTQAAARTRGLVYLFGPDGCGKTHLLYAAQRKARALGRNAVYLPLASLGAPTAAIEALDISGLICLDDVDAIAGADAAERALMSLYDAVKQGGGACSILASATEPPAAAGFRLADLASRLASGTSYRLGLLDDAGKTAALRLRAKIRGFDLPDDVVAYIMRHHARDNPSLFSLLDQLDSASLVEQRRITLRFLQQLERRTEDH
jgi:DnaA family protein